MIQPLCPCHCLHDSDIFSRYHVLAFLESARSLEFTMCNARTHVHMHWELPFVECVLNN